MNRGTRSASLTLALTLAATALLPLAAHAQSRIDLPYSDANGRGTLIINRGDPPSSGTQFQSIRVTLDQNNLMLPGAGVALDLQAASGGSSGPGMLLAFNLVTANGKVIFYQGSFLSVNGYAGGGTYYPVDSPQMVLPWSVVPFDGGNPSPPGETIVNSTPTLMGNWTRSSSSDAQGGFYSSTLNLQIGVGIAAPPEVIWSGDLPAGAKRYRVDVFIPVQPSGRRPRTNSARYYIIYHTGGSIGPVVRFLSQQVRSSQWITLETVDFSNSGGRYAISLGAATNDAAGTKSVVANAVRLVPVP